MAVRVGVDGAAGGAMIGPAFAALLGDAKGGDEHAFGVLYRDLQPSLLRYLRVPAPGGC